MFTLPIKQKYIKLENLMDNLMIDPVVVVKNTKINTKTVQLLGIFGQELRRKKMLNVSYDPKLKETTLILKCNNFYNPGAVTKKINDHGCIKYIFNDTNIPKITWPKIPDFNL